MLFRSGVLKNEDNNVIYYNKNDIVRYIPNVSSVKTLYSEKADIENITKKYPIVNNKNKSITRYSDEFINIYNFQNKIKKYYPYLYLTSCFMIILASIIYLGNIFKKNKYEIKLYKTLGIKNNEVKFIYVLHFSVILIISFILSFILYYYVISILNQLFLKLFSTKIIKLNINYSCNIIIFTITLILALFKTIKINKIKP